MTNKVTFSGIGVNVNRGSFGTVGSAISNSGSRDFQFDLTGTFARNQRPLRLA